MKYYNPAATMFGMSALRGKGMSLPEGMSGTELILVFIGACCISWFLCHYLPNRERLDKMNPITVFFETLANKMEAYQKRIHKDN